MSSSIQDPTELSDSTFFILCVAAVGAIIHQLLTVEACFGLCLGTSLCQRMQENQPGDGLS